MNETPHQNINISLGQTFGLQRMISIVAGLTFVVYIGYLAWMSLGPQKPVPDPLCKKLADQAVDKIVEQVQASRGEIRNAVLLHFSNDPSDYVSEKLRAKLNSTGILMLDDRSFPEKLKMLLNFRDDGVSTAEEAIDKAKDHDTQGILWGTVYAFETSNAGTIVKGNWQLLDKATGKAVASCDFEESTVSGGYKLLNGITGKTGPLQQVADRIPWYIRFLGFTLLFLLLPVFTISFIRGIVARHSNKLNAFLLGVYTVIDMILAFFMVGGSFVTAWAVIFFLLGSLLAFGYNYLLMCYALRLES